MMRATIHFSSVSIDTPFDRLTYLKEGIVLTLTEVALSLFRRSMAMESVTPSDRARLEVDLDTSIIEVIDATLTIADDKLLFCPSRIEVGQ